MNVRTLLAGAAVAAIAIAPAPAGAELVQKPRWQIVVDQLVTRVHAANGIVYLGGTFDYVARARSGGEWFLDATTGEPMAGCAHFTGDPTTLQGPWGFPDPLGGMFLRVEVNNLGLADANGPFSVLPGQSFVRVGPDCRFDRSFVLRDYFTPTDPWYAGLSIVRAPAGIWVGGRPRTGGARITLFNAVTGTRVVTTLLPGLSDVNVRAVAADGRLLITGQLADGRGTRIFGLLDPGTLGFTPIVPASTTGTVVQVSGGVVFYWLVGSASPVQAFDLSTAAPKAGWSGPVMSAVYSVAVSGSKVFVSGTVGGVTGVTSYDLASGSPIPWNVPFGPGGAAAILHVAGGRLWVYDRSLRTVGGVDRFEAAALDPTTGAVDAWRNTRFLDATAPTGFVPTDSFVFVGSIRSDPVVLRARLAAVDQDTGFVTGWNPSDGSAAPLANVSAIAASPTEVFVSGAGGLLRRAPVTGGSLEPFAAVSHPADPGSAAIRDLAVRGGVVYAVGRFTEVTPHGGVAVPRNHAAAISTSSRAVAAWNPNASDRVEAVIATDAAVYLGGFFTLMGGVARDRLAAVDPASGAVQALNVGPQGGDMVEALALDGNALFYHTGLSEAGRVNLGGAGGVVWRTPPFIFGGLRVAVLNGRFFGRRELDAATGQETRTPGFEYYAWNATRAGGGILQVYSGGVDYYVSGTADVPTPPTDLSGLAAGNDVSFSWSAPASLVSSYLLAAGSAPGQSDIGTFDLNSRAPRFFGSAPNGTYFVRVHARNAFGIGQASNEFRLVVGPPACTGAPPAPTGLQATVTGTTVSLTWEPALAATAYVLQAGGAPGGSELAQLTLGAGTTFSTAAAPGVYYVRVRGANACGTGPASNEAVVRIGTTVPGPPGTLTFGVNGHMVTLAWTTPTTGGAPTGYVLEAGSRPGLADIVTMPVTGLQLATPAAPGRYYVRVRAVNTAGQGPPSNEVRIDVP